MSLASDEYVVDAEIYCSKHILIFDKNRFCQKKSFLSIIFLWSYCFV